MPSYAIIGSGISGLSAAYYLKKEQNIDVCVYESSNRIGGHSYTYTANNDNVDLGFQVSNPKTYPNLYTFFEEIDVRKFLSKTSMSFSVKNSKFEWAVNSFRSMLSLVFSMSFYKLLFELFRFNKIANTFITDGNSDETIDGFICKYKFSNDFTCNYLYPFTSCVWSTGTEHVGKYNAKNTFVFMKNHGLLSILNSYKWYFLTCNCDTYINKIRGIIGDIIKTEHKLTSIFREQAKWLLTFENGATAYADNVVFACRGDQVYSIIKNNNAISNNVIDAFSKLKITRNTITLHRDERDMPKNINYWSSWNYTSDPDNSNYRCTYWMKPLQNTKDNKLFATMHNVEFKPNYKEKIFEWNTDHPHYDENTPKCIECIQNYNYRESIKSGVWFCGAYMGYGFHEDGIVSAKRVVENITENKEYKPFEPSTNNRSYLMKCVDSFSIKILLCLFKSYFRKGNMHIWFPDYDTYTIKNDNCNTNYVNISIQKPSKMLYSLITRSDLGLMEEMISDNLQPNSVDNFMNILTINYSSHKNKDNIFNQIYKICDLVTHKLRRNTIQNSKINISKHYDLSNKLYELFLDTTMTYSSAYFNKFTSSGIPYTDFKQTLMDAQINKYNRIIDKLNLTGNEHILEIGCGWGGFAEVLSQRFPNTKWTGLTLSIEQAKYCNNRLILKNNHSNVVTEDYRTFINTHPKQYDRVVSIEMIEAVGYEYFDLYFKCIHTALRNIDSFAVIQAITIPDHRFDAYRKSIGFINMYIFPGGLCPSICSIINSASKCNMVIDSTENFANSYSETLQRWNANFQQNWNQIKEIGFDLRFKKIWELYLLYCQYGFKNDLIAVHHITLKQSPK
jgi:cyclopropane-fatty-acyl-phospholipid synthase